ncbi:hypothetical protein AB0N05_27075 [Nocardia sp. NPDC051030]|uniref:hypothetical protein n=1 Tax=Nocardia sp. NPDC051030 TaxID=3155162 RepID=UPI0034331BD2
MVIAGEFVVGVDTAAVQRSRERGLWWKAFSARFQLATALGMSALAALMVYLAGPIGLMQFLPAAIFGYVGVRDLRRLRRQRESLRAAALPEVAMRLSANGLAVGTDAGPDSVFLPWDTVRGLRLHSWLRQELLVIDLFPEVTADTPGVRGLDREDIQAILRTPVHGTTGLRTATKVLTQPVSAIDEAAAHFTGGRVRVL